MPAPLYFAETPGACATAQIEGLTLLYHRPSGITHFLDSPIPEILALLAGTPCDAAALTERLCRQLDLPCDDEARTVVATRLDELAAIGLVRSA